MQFTKIASVAVLFFLSFIAVAFASPTARDTTDLITSILDGLKSDVAGPISNINAIAKQDPSTHDQAATDVQTIISAVQLAQTKIIAVKNSGVSKRQSSDEVANLVAGVVSEITTSVAGVAGSGLVAILLPGLDTALNAVLAGLETLLAGVLNLVATLLVDVAGLLRSLALGLTLGALGL